MPPKSSQNKSKRQRLDQAGAKLRAAFGIDVENPLRKKVDPATLLADAWTLASNITDFATTYLRHFMVDPVSGEFTPPAEFHKELYQILMVEKYAAVAAPREHAKSTVVSVILPLYCICYKLRRFIVLISDTQSQAALQMAAIKEELETNEELKKQFGDLMGDKKWDINDCRTSTGISIAARGAGQSLRGLRYRMWRPDLVICDDMENEEAVDNPESREKLVRWFKGTVMNLGKYCQIFVIGTILRYDSFLSDLLSDDKFKTFKKKRYMAVDLEWTPESVLWPEKWSLAELRQKEEDLQSVMFNQEFRNLPISEETQVFREEWITRHQYWRQDVQNIPLYKISYYDPAISEKKKADFFASITVGIDLSDGRIYVLRAEQGKMPFIKQVDFICDRWDDERPEVVGIEDVAYQVALRQTVEEVSARTGRYMNIVGVPHTTDKFMRIATMSGLVERGIIRFCLDGTQKTLISQLLFLGKIKDDLADALESAVALARANNFRAAIASCGPGVGTRDPLRGRGAFSGLMAANAQRDMGMRQTQEDFIQRDRRSVWR